MQFDEKCSENDFKASLNQGWKGVLTHAKNLYLTLRFQAEGWFFLYQNQVFFCKKWVTF